MRKFLVALGLATLLSLGTQTEIQAAVVDSTEADFGFDAAGEVTDTLVIAGDANVTVFVSGTYSVANLVFLQREKGSPGSGVFENVLQVAGTGSGLAADGTAEYLWTNGPNANGYRVFMSAAGTGDVMVQMTDRSGASTPFTPNDRSVMHYFTDFNEWQTTAVNAELFLTIDNDSSGTVAVIGPTVEEGAITLASGTVGDRADETAFSFIDVSDWAGLVSDGPILFEVRLQTDVLTGIVGALLTTLQIPAATNASSPFDVDSNVVTQENSHVNALAIMHQSEADDVDGWIAVSQNGNAEGNDGGAVGTGDEFEVGTAVAATYFDLKLETDAAGDCYFYVDNDLQYAEDACVATTARLGWWVWANTDDNASAVTLIIDYVEFQTTKPAS